MASKSGGDFNTPIRKGLEFLCQTFRCEIDAWERRAYERTLKDIDPGVLAEAAQLLVDQAAAGRTFYPLPTAPDWKGACKTVIANRLKAARALHLADCSHSSQWIYNPETRRDERCPCYVRMMAAVEAIGTLELPPTPSREDAMELGS